MGVRRGETYAGYSERNNVVGLQVTDCLHRRDIRLTCAGVLSRGKASGAAAHGFLSRFKETNFIREDMFKTVV